MRFMIMVRANATTEAGVMPDGATGWHTVSFRVS